jgi:hypothetical protein
MSKKKKSKPTDCLMNSGLGIGSLFGAFAGMALGSIVDSNIAKKPKKTTITMYKLQPWKFAKRGGTVKKIEVDRFTDKSYWIDGKRKNRWSKYGDGDSVYETTKEIALLLVRKQEKRVLWEKRKLLNLEFDLDSMRDGHLPNEFFHEKGNSRFGNILRGDY